MNPIQIVFAAFLAVVAAHEDHSSAYHVHVNHEHHPVHHHHDSGDHYGYVHSKPVAVEAPHHYGGESYSSGHDSHHEIEHSDDHHDYHHHPSYKFEYGVKDPKTGDHHSQWEHRDGDKVHGEYTLDEADGTKRVVKYSSDKHTGFQAHVERIGHAHHPHGHHHHHHDEHHY